MKSTVKTIVIVVLAMLLTFSAALTLFTFGLLDCWGMNDLRELIARDILLDELSKVEVTEPEEDNSPVVVVPETATKEESKTPQVSIESETGPAPEEDIEPLCIWNMNGIKITVLGLEMDGFYGPEMYIEIENNTDNNLMFGIDDVSVNGYMMDPYWAASVAAGKKARETIYWFEESCVENGVEDIYRVECVFRVSDEDTWTTVIETPTIGIDFEW